MKMYFYTTFMLILLFPYTILELHHTEHKNKMISKIVNKEYNILDFGADPSGKIDCSKIISAAIDSAGIEGSVYIPQGEFLIEKTITIMGKDKFKLKCDGLLKINLNQEAFRILDCSWCKFNGLCFISTDSIGQAIKLLGKSRFNVFENIIAQGVNNYIFEIVNNTTLGIPDGTIIRNVDTRYSKGLLKDITEDNSDHGKEISISNIRGATRLDKYEDDLNCPAFILLKNIHDIFLSNLEGEHKYTYLLLEGDCNATINNIMVSSYTESTIKFTSSQKSELNFVNFTNSYLWGIPQNNKYYKPNYALEVESCHLISIDNVIISNYDRAAICQKSDGEFFYSNIRFVNNIRDIEFYSMNPETTILNFNNISADHANKGESIFFAADSINLGSLRLHCVNSTFKIKNRKQNSVCKVFDFIGGVIDSINCSIYP